MVNADSKISYQQASWNEITHSVEYTAKTATSPTTLYTDSTAWEDCKLYVVPDGGVTISSHITVTGTVNLSLTDGNTLTATKDITISGNNTLNIYVHSVGNNASLLLINSVDDCTADICGFNPNGNSIGGTVTIHGGQVTVTGGVNSVGIGGVMQTMQDDRFVDLVKQH